MALPRLASPGSFCVSAHSLIWVAHRVCLLVSCWQRVQTLTSPATKQLSSMGLAYTGLSSGVHFNTIHQFSSLIGVLLFSLFDHSFIGRVSSPERGSWSRTSWLTWSGLRS